ncbi:MAG: pirin family protein, partial [Betaproteobacteria bacterium]|nr:pirin family protein [Betaproteobacteria bacterium]
QAVGNLALLAGQLLLFQCIDQIDRREEANPLMIEGEVLHRDSLGNEQIIRPGQVNLMTAGRGVVHTEDSLHDGQRLHAAQLWIALPPEVENCLPNFAHHSDLPQWRQDNAQLTLLAGTYDCWTAPARIHSPLLGLDIGSDRASSVTLTLDPSFEYGLLPLQGEICIENERVPADELAYLGQGHNNLQLDLDAASKVLVLGGRPFGQPVLMWWNFVGWSKAGIAEAQRQWESGDIRFGPVSDGLAPRLSPPPLPWRD